jgi:hypothetical protein
MRTGRVLAIFLVAAAGAAALANDSVAETAAGGLVLKQSNDIDMLSEDLYVSAREIRVRYVFRNRSARPIRTAVAFPMPDRDLSRDEEGDVSWPADFATRVDGRPVAMQVERRVFARGAEHTALLRQLAIPISGHDADGLGAAIQAIQRLPEVEQRRLAGLGLIERSRAGVSILWTVKETWHWEQVFPAGRNLVVEHRYTPGAGGSAGTALASPEYRRSDDGREQIAQYCIDDDFLRAIDALAARSGSIYPTITETWISYILTTGGNWRAPIGDFRLVVDKGDARNLVSFCGQGVRRISPTRFEMRRRNWRPPQDLHVLILVPHDEND